MRKIIGTLSFASVALILASCSNGGFTRTSGYFTYKIDKQTNELMLIGLSEEGQKQKTIVIPSMINGKPVARIGHKITRFLAYGSSWETEFKSDVLETIYFPSGLGNTHLSKSMYRELPNLKYIFWGDVKINHSLCAYGDICFFVSSKNHESNADQYSSFADYYGNVLTANVCYYLSVGTDNTYFVDYADGTKVNVIPPTPYKEGFEFVGWYKDQELSTLWDFENDIASTRKAGETKIYAKWKLIVK